MVERGMLASLSTKRLAPACTTTRCRRANRIAAVLDQRANPRGGAMPGEGGRPTVFLSSTIRDFADLRGAIKFWLEENGFEVWLSEFNDFDKRPGANAFDACFESVRRADFYVLLIGDKRGSLYAGDITVTQQEYRVAYEAFRADSHPIPLLFARKRTTDLLDGWRSARPTVRSSQPFAEATFVEALIEEVEHRGETQSAVAGVGAYPPANWLHRFDDFRI